MTSETEAMIEKAEYWDWAMDNWLMAESLIDALRAAEERERELRKALEPFSEAARLALPSGRPPSEFCDAQDYQAARQTLRGKS